LKVEYPEILFIYSIAVYKIDKNLGRLYDALLPYISSCNYPPIINVPANTQKNISVDTDNNLQASHNTLVSDPDFITLSSSSNESTHLLYTQRRYKASQNNSSYLSKKRKICKLLFLFWALHLHGKSIMAFFSVKPSTTSSALSFLILLVLKFKYLFKFGTVITDQQLPCFCSQKYQHY